MQSKNKPLVSVIVPAYNEQEHIEECLQSIKSQSYKSVQLIVVDDGSTDSTQKIAKKYVDIFITQKHQGPGIARNLGANRAKGDILVFIDADMYLDRDYVVKIIRPIIEKKCLATFTKEEYVANQDNIWSKCFNIDNNLPINRRIPVSAPSVSTKFRAIDRDYFSQVGGYKTDIGYGEDDILTKQKAIEASGAISYHYNPSTLKDVFFSARWIGRSRNMQTNIRNILKYSIINSLNISIKKIIDGESIFFLLFKVIFDAGVLSGILFKTKYNEK